MWRHIKRPGQLLRLQRSQGVSMEVHRPIVDSSINAFDIRIGCSQLAPEVSNSETADTATLSVSHLTGEGVQSAYDTMRRVALMATASQRLETTHCFKRLGQGGLAIVAELIDIDECEALWFIVSPHPCQLDQAQLLIIVAVGTMDVVAAAFVVDVQPLQQSPQTTLVIQQQPGAMFLYQSQAPAAALMTTLTRVTTDYQ